MKRKNLLSEEVHHFGRKGIACCRDAQLFHISSY